MLKRMQGRGRTLRRMKTTRKRESELRALLRAWLKQNDRGISTQAQLADALGVSEGAISKWFRTGRISFDNFNALHDLTGIPVVKLRRAIRVEAPPESATIGSRVDEFVQELHPDQRKALEALLNTFANMVEVPFPVAPIEKTRKPDSSKKH